MGKKTQPKITLEQLKNGEWQCWGCGKVMPKEKGEQHREHCPRFSKRLWGSKALRWLKEE